MRINLLFLFCFFVAKSLFSHKNDLNYFLGAAKKNNPSLLEKQNLQQIGKLQNQLINAQNSKFQVDVTSEVMVAPYFNSNGKFIEITTNPSLDAYGYAEPVSNGALYSTQLNITKNIFSRVQVQNLLFPNKLKNKSLELSSAEIKHQMLKNITDAYIQG